MLRAFRTKALLAYEPVLRMLVISRQPLQLPPAEVKLTPPQLTLVALFPLPIKQPTYIGLCTTEGIQLSVAKYDVVQLE